MTTQLSSVFVTLTLILFVLQKNSTYRFTEEVLQFSDARLSLVVGGSGDKLIC